MAAIRLFVVRLFLMCLLLSFTKSNLAQAQKTINNLQIDTVYLKSVESSHFKISLPVIEKMKTYQDLFNTYGEISTVKIKSKSRQFLGDFKNISRAKYVNGALNRAGINNTKITLFEIWVPPIIPKKEKRVAAPKEKTVLQNPINNEQSNKRKKKFKNNAKTSSLNPSNTNFEEKNKKTNPFPSRPKTATVNSKAQAAAKKTKTPTKKVEAKKPSNTKNTTNKATANKPKNTKTSTNKPATNNIESEVLVEDQFILVLPKVTNPAIYKYVLKDLGTVDTKKLPNDQWYYYLGFFKDAEIAETIIPKINERGFTSTAKVSHLKNAEKTALSMYKNLPPISTNKPEKKKNNTASKQIDKSLYYKIELPPVSNPEIYFKAFEDVGLGFSEITPNGKAIYYIGEFETVTIAKAKVAELKERGLSNGTIVKFKNDIRLDAYAEIYLEKVTEVTEVTEAIVEEEIKKAVNIKTHPDGSFQIRLKQVENPDVLKSVFEDVGKLKVGYLQDDTEYYYIGNYLFQKEAEKIIAHLKERGLTKIDLINVMAADVTPKIAAENISAYKIKLGTLKDETLSLFEPYGTLSNVKKDKITTYYLGNYPTKKVANLILQELKGLKLDVNYEIKFFAE